MSEWKVTASHRSRTAIIYVRQSTLLQVERNRESTARQYDLVSRARELGWPRTAVTVIDEDLGLSGASAAGRAGFAELAARVGMGQVEIVLSLECSRLARNNADWYRLLDLAGMTDTLIADADGVYHPAVLNDRLVLGLKWVAPLIRRGFVSEACEVDGAGGVEGLLRGAGRESGAQECVFVAFPGGGIDGEAEGVGGAAVAEPEQRDLLAVAEHAGDVGEAAVVSGPDFGQLRPVLLGVIQQPQDDRAAGRFGDGGHVPHHAA